MIVKFLEIDSLKTPLRKTSLIFCLSLPTFNLNQPNSSYTFYKNTIQKISENASAGSHKSTTVF